MAEKTLWEEIILNDSGHRDDSTVFHQNDLNQIGSIKVVNIDLIISAYDMIPSYHWNLYANQIYKWMRM